MVFFTQSIWGLLFVNQGIPNTIWAHPRPTIMKDRSSSKAVAWQWTQVAAVICPCLFGVLSTFRAWRGDIGHEGRWRWLTREGLMKFPVAPQSTRAVVTTVLTPYLRWIGNQITRSDWFTTNTEVMTKEVDIAMASCSKKMLCLFCQLLPLTGEDVTTHQISFLFLPALLHISPSLIHWWMWS